MARFIIQPHGRLNDWVAEEKGYFGDEGLDYVLDAEAGYKTVPQLAVAVKKDAPIKDNLFGAFAGLLFGQTTRGRASVFTVTAAGAKYGQRGYADQNQDYPRRSHMFPFWIVCPRHFGETRP